MAKTVFLQNAHMVTVSNRDKPLDPSIYPFADQYSIFYDVKLAPGQMWRMAKGHPQAPNQYVVWYANNKMYSGSGNTMSEALNNAVEQAWLYI